VSDVRETPAIRPATVARWRVVLIGVGLLLLLVGGITLLNDVNPKRYIGIASWFLGALIIHDGIIAFVVVGINVALRRAGRRVPLPVLLILQGAIVVGAIMALIVFPEIMKQAIGTGNATLLPLDYARNLVFFYVALAVTTAIAIAVYLRMRAHKRTKA
jgi:cation transport ATPase